MKEILRKVLLVAICVFLAGCSMPDNENVSDVSEEAVSLELAIDEGYQHALEYGFVPENFLNDGEKTITEKEMAELSVAAIRLCDEVVADEWAESLKNASEEQLVHRDYGALFLFLSAQMMGCEKFLEWDYYNAQNAYNNK